MRHLLNKITKLIFPVVFLIICACFSAFAINSNHLSNVQAATSDIVEVSITNKNFNSSSSTSLQTSPTGWSKINDDYNIKQGVISVDSDDFSNNKTSYGFENVSENPGTSGTTSSDTKVLMINNNSTDECIAGFESSTKTTLEANSYYVVAVNVKTTSTAIASIYLDGIADEYDITNSYVGVNFQQWTKVMFYIQTGVTSKDVKIQLYLGTKETPSASAVFFDNIEFYRTSQSTFSYLLNNSLTENSSIVDPNKKTYKQINITENFIDITNQITNANFDNPAQVNMVAIANTETSFVDVTTNKQYSNLSNNNQYAFVIKNATKAYSAYEYQNIVIPAYGIYSISIDAKNIGTISGGSVVLKLVENDDITEQNSSYEPQTAELTIEATTNAVKNDFNTYTFIVKGNGIAPTSFNLQIVFGSQDDPTSAEIAFDNIVFRSLTSDYLDETVDNSTKLKLNLYSSTPTIENGYFNNYTINTPITFDSYNNPIYDFPFGVETWTHSYDTNIDESLILYGILNTKTGYFNSSIGTSNPQNPTYNLVDDSTLVANSNSNNIFMFKNSAYTYQTLTYSSLTLSASTIYQISFDVKTLLNAGVMSFEVINNNKTIASFSSIDTDGEWKSYKVYVKTSTSEKSIDIKFNFGTTKQGATGFGFIDNVRLTTRTLSDEKFANLYSQSYTKVVDYQDGNWNIVSDTQNEYGVWELLTSTSALAEGAFAGVIAGQENAFDVTSAKTENNNMLIVSNTQKGTSSITTNNDINLTSGLYYRVTMNILTQRVSELGEDEDFGASIKLSNFDATIKNIITNGEFKTYIFYVNPTEDVDCGLTLALYSPLSKALGTVILDNLNIEELTSVEYNEATERQQSKNLSNIAVISTESEDADDTDEEETEEETSSSSLTDKEIWLLVPSILFGIAVIFAIIVFALRRIKIKKFEKLNQASYNRASTLDHEKAKIQAKKNIDNLIAEQNELKEIVQNELKDLEAKYQQDLKEFRASGSTKSNKIEKEFKSYMNQKSKLDATIVSINQKIKQLENPEVLILEEKKLYTAELREKQKVKNTVKKETKKIEKQKKSK